MNNLIKAVEVDIGMGMKTIYVCRWREALIKPNK